MNDSQEPPRKSFNSVLALSEELAKKGWSLAEQSRAMRAVLQAHRGDYTTLIDGYTVTEIIALYQLSEYI